MTDEVKWIGDYEQNSQLDGQIAMYWRNFRMNDTILCPYCGAEMIKQHDDNHSFDRHYYWCHGCGAQSPYQGSEDGAKYAAHKRYTPMQKPLTLGEAKVLIGVWIEDSCCDYGAEIFPAIYKYRGYPHHSVFIADIDDGDEKAWYDNECYGIDWRCWASRPTNEERASARWED